MKIQLDIADAIHISVALSRRLTMLSRWRKNFLNLRFW